MPQVYEKKGVVRWQYDLGRKNNFEQVYLLKHTFFINCKAHAGRCFFEISNILMVFPSYNVFVFLLVFYFILFYRFLVQRRHFGSSHCSQKMIQTTYLHFMAQTFQHVLMLRFEPCELATICSALISLTSCVTIGLQILAYNICCQSMYIKFQISTFVIHIFQWIYIN